MKSSLWSQFLRFVAVGITNSLVDFGVFNLLLRIFPTKDLQLLVTYNSIGVLLAVANSYVWNTRFTFRAPMKGPDAARQRLLFGAQALFNVGVNDAVVALLTRLLTLRGEELLTPAVAGNLSKMVAMVVASVLSFLLMRYVVYAGA
jgi:putative flippase GtrA